MPIMWTVRTQRYVMMTEDRPTGTVNVCFDQNVDTTDAVKLNLLVLVLPPVTHSNEVFPTRIIFLISLSENSVRVQSLSQPAAFVGFDPRIVVN